MHTLVLASGSNYRKELLTRLRIPFLTSIPDLDESALPEELPQQTCERLSRSKAQAVAKLFPSSVVIGSDQVASLDGVLLGKPGNLTKATEQLHSCSGKKVLFYTGLCVQQGDQQQFHLSQTVVNFRNLRAAEISAYLNAETPWDCAGSFKAEGLGICLFDSIDSSDPTDLIGLPLIPLCRMLRQLGIDPLGQTI